MRLVVYGTLGPGEVNHHQLSALQGHWTRGVVKGTLFEPGWTPRHNAPGIAIDEAGADVPVHLFESRDLLSYWPRLDAFEGPTYRRRIVQVIREAEILEAWIYEMKA